MAVAAVGERQLCLRRASRRDAAVTGERLGGTTHDRRLGPSITTAVGWAWALEEEGVVEGLGAEVSTRAGCGGQDKKLYCCSGCTKVEMPAGGARLASAACGWKSASAKSQGLV